MAGKKQHFNFSTMHLSDIPSFFVALFKGQVGRDEPNMTEQTGFYEINLVPDIKSEMIRMQKLRNVMFFACIMISVAAVSVMAILGSIKGAQDITMASQDSHIKNLSEKIKDYEELPEFLTIQNQLKGIAAIEDRQKVLSRTMGFLSAMLDVGEDEIKTSELTVNLDTTTMSFDAQADAKKDSIDYRVLEAFIKRTNLMTFDYGRYVDADGNVIPTRCIVEYDNNGKMFEENGSIYAIWKRGEKGCDPSRDDYEDTDENSTTVSEVDADLESTKMVNGSSKVSKVETNKKSNTISSSDVKAVKENDAAKDSENSESEEDEADEKKTSSEAKKVINVVPNEKIYRTPQFTDWHNGKEQSTKSDGVDDDLPEHLTSGDEKTVYNTAYYNYKPSMSLSNGEILNVPHFESSCIQYSGAESDSETDSNGKPIVKWSAANECKLVPDGVKVAESSNGQDQDKNLVLTFSASITINPDAFAYKNKHVMAIGPNGQNVTDSYVQLEKLFTAPAVECSNGDTSCNNTTNKEGM